DVDLYASLLDDAADDLASGADDLADLLGPDFERDDTRSVTRHLTARLGDRLVHDTEDMLAAFLRLVERVAHDLARNAGDLNIHLQRCDALARARDFEIHIAEMVLIAENVRKNADLIAFFDEPHCDAGDGRAGRHAGRHQCQRAAADSRHRSGPVRFENLRDHPDGIGKSFFRRQHWNQRALGQVAVADIAAARA